MTDARLHPANGRVIWAGADAPAGDLRPVEAAPASIAVPVADLSDTPGGARQRQLVYGDVFEVLEGEGGYAFGFARRDGYVGYLPTPVLGPYAEATHVVASGGTHLYSAADLKSREIAALSFGARLAVLGQEGRFARTSEGFVPAGHLRPVGASEQDPGAAALRFLGTPYLWGGNGRAGIDCSGLVQAVLLACGIACPGDSDLQEQAFAPLAGDAPLARGDLIFWRGHVAMALSEVEMIHANAHHMAVAVEETAAAIARIEADGGGAVTSRRRPGGA